ncbi:MAG TPA: hypothetical protein PKE55_08240 [Kiritimatiellia bacterium]|nr:hypothetical protein [Kiritimatiellia bacterium]
MKSLFRHTPALAWVFFEKMVVTGIPRLLLFPIAAYLIGKDQFGLFATLLSLSMLIGHQPAIGLSDGLLRNFTSFPPERQPQLAATAIRLCQTFMLLFLTLVVLSGGLVHLTGTVDSTTLATLLLLFLSLYPENLFLLSLTHLRYQRKFKTHALWHTLPSITALALGSLGVYLFGIPGLAGGILAANLIAWLSRRMTHQLPAPESPPGELSRILKNNWLHLSIAGAFTIASPHLNRIVLNAYWDHAAVADLFAATSILFIFTIPITNLSKYIFGMAAKYTSISQLSTRTLRTLATVALTGSLASSLLFLLTAPFLLRTLYPAFGDSALMLFAILVWKIPSSLITALVKPLVTKFADVRWIPVINFVILASTLFVMFLLIPRYGLQGAAWSMTSTSIVAAVLYLGLLTSLMLKASPNPPLRNQTS